jgi:hypothetical protein
MRAADESQLAATISANLSESAATTKPVVVSEAAPANASLPAPMLLSVAVAADGIESAATEAAVSEAAPANASPPAPVRMSVAAGVSGCVAAPTDSAVAEATPATAISAVADHGTLPTARSLPRLGIEQLERASQPSEVSLSDQTLSRAILFDFLKQAFLYSSELKAIICGCWCCLYYATFLSYEPSPTWCILHLPETSPFALSHATLGVVDS